MATTGLIGKRNIEALELDLEAPDEIYAGVETLLRVRIANRRRFLPAFLIRAELDGYSTLLPYLPCAASDSATLLISFPHRGVQRFATIRVASAFPVAFFRRARALTLDGEVLVFPAPRPLAGPISGEGVKPRGESHSLARHGQQGEIARISDYTGAESLKRIHWKLSARHEELKVKELEDLASEPVMIDPEQLPGAGLEERLGSAVWLIARLLRAGRPVGLRLGALRIPPAIGRDQKLKLLRALALYGCA